VEVTIPPKPSMGKGRFSDSASRQAVTRVNAEQASKHSMWQPTQQRDGEGRIRVGPNRRRTPTYRPAYRSKRQDDRRHCADPGHRQGRHHGRGPCRRAGADRRELGFLTAHLANRSVPRAAESAAVRPRRVRGRAVFRRRGHRRRVGWNGGNSDRQSLFWVSPPKNDSRHLYPPRRSVPASWSLIRQASEVPMP
jgi:hypothetical protein